MPSVRRIEGVLILYQDRAALAVPLLLIGASFGCDSGPQVAPVSGVVLVDGEPLVGASVNTQPFNKTDGKPGAGSFGKTDSEGRYSLELVQPAMPGAIVGKHRVTITPEFYAANAGRDYDVDDEDVPVDATPRPPPWPTKYVDGSLTLTVPPEGTDQADFSLSVKP